MPGRNLAKPFAIAGFILAEIYMLATVLAPYGHVDVPLPMPAPAPEVSASVEPGTPRPLKTKLSEIAVLSLFFGPFGAIAGTGVGLLVSGLRGDFREKEKPQP